MDERRIERALRLGPVDEPAYQPGSWRAERDADDGPEALSAPLPLPQTARPDATVPGLERLRPAGVRMRDPRRLRRRSVPTTLAASLALVVTALLVAQAVPRGPAAEPEPSPDLLGRLMAAGQVEVAVTNGAPQTLSQGGAYIGFDVDVAKAIAAQLGLQANVTAIAPDAVSTGAWQLALAGHRGQTLDGSPTQPYAYWPVWLAAPDGSAVTDLAALAAARVCIVDGSAGADWLAGGVGDARATAPIGVMSITLASDDECIAAVTDGRADAMLTTALFSAEVEARGLHLVVSTPVVSDPWAVVVRGPEADSSSLVAALNDAIARLRASGRLAQLSAAAFGGLDITVQGP